MAASTSTTEACNVILLGDAAVGKSALLSQYIEGVFLEEHEPTLLDCLRYDAENIDEHYYVMNLIDCCADRDFRTQRAAYICTADVVVLVYAANRLDSIRHLIHYAHDVVRARKKLVNPARFSRTPSGHAGGAAKDNTSGDGGRSGGAERSISWRKRNKPGEKKSSGGDRSPSRRKRKSKSSKHDTDDAVPYIAEVRVPMFFIGTCADLLPEDGDAAAQTRHSEFVQSVVTECLKDAGLETGPLEEPREGEILYPYVPKGASTRLPLYELSAKDSGAVQRAFHAVARMHHNYRLAYPNVMQLENDIEDATMPVYSSECVAAPRRQSTTSSFLKKKKKKKGPPTCNASPPPLDQYALDEDEDEAHSRPVSLPATPCLYVSDASLSTSRRSACTSDDDVALYTSPDFMDRMEERARARERARTRTASDTETETETNGGGGTTTTDGTSVNNEVAMEEYDSEAAPALSTSEKPRLMLREKQPSMREQESSSDDDGAADPQEPAAWNSRHTTPSLPSVNGADLRGREVPTPKRRKGAKSGDGSGGNENCCVL